ncbi:hypothetical protein AM493_15145 [Flavobacterium akiainvivens]|uniref:Uncharacterized protein n=1 Tax=Flavobacterium akiainvivens TaxID=1202724 RepID=A0A0N0RQZ3_9FLAO|nr:hypothetical protein [Flavobacterium akiainvivens]KOS07222.1 hypothetical protein AM493_15145 [Flavobacterium akiainvivens]SFQ45247.1 hypothetical protein SAMN05444144_10511 [Flavobacterium akiainvivens]
MFTENDDYIALTGDTEDISILHNDFNLSELAMVFPDVNSILVPKKAQYNLTKYVPKALLREIDPNTNIAVEKCLLVLSNLASTYYTEDPWKSLSSAILHEQTKNASNTYIYTKIVELLKAGTKTGAFIEVADSYEVGVQSKKYRLTEQYLKAGLTEYLIKNSGIIATRNRLFYQQLANAMTNPISANLVKMYPKLQLPISAELLTIGKKLVKEGRTTKKGKLLTMRNKHKNDYWNDWKNRSFVEDNIKLFEFLTGRGFMVPSAGDAASGGRVVDSFTLMPAWIREQITIDGKKLAECDYTALHPNIAIHLYGGNESYITHQKVAERAAIDVKAVKVEHLAFFNKKWVEMKKSPLYKFYSEHKPLMLERIRKDKATNGYKVTSRKMFMVEVDIMTDVITNLSAKGIQVLYVYDALLCEEKDKSAVIETMNRVILEQGVKTEVKL